MFEAGPVLLALGETSCTSPLCSAADRWLTGLLAQGWLDVLAMAIGSAWSTIAAYFKDAHSHVPALVLELAALITIPPLALLGHFIARRRATADLATRLAILARTPGDHHGKPGGPITTPQHAEDRSHSSAGAGDGLTWPVDAWLKVDGAGDGPIPVVRELMRIGREDDNDIVLSSPTVHRYHALVQRTDGEIVVLDLSGEDGNGVLVNGKRISRQRLKNGDRIDVGDASLTFSARRV